MELGNIPFDTHAGKMIVNLVELIMISGKRS